jgi:glycine/D-amino acid oxidase-like deaminating enzyme
MSLPRRAEVVIVGGGFAGAATAYALTRAGIGDVLVLERERSFGYHASGRNAALCRQIVEDEGVTALTVRGAAFLRSPPAGFSDVPLLAQVGSILLLDTAAAADALATRVRAHGVAGERMTPAAVVARLGYLSGITAGGAVAIPTDGVIDIHALLEGYLRAARRGGARTVTGCDVSGFRPGDADPVVVDTSQGPVAARCVVTAAGAWAGPVGERAGAAPAGLSPIHRHLFVTEPVPSLDRRAPFVWHIGADPFYVRPEGPGFLVSSCDATLAEPHDAVPQPDAVATLADKLTRTAPALADLGVARTWACLRTFAGDGRPIIDWDADVPWLFWVAGLGGHGATASAAIGELAASRIRGRLRKTAGGPGLRPG